MLRLSSSGFDLLLTEVFLLDNDGFEFLSTVTAENKSLPVVAFSANRGRPVAIQALRQGACAFYPKPIAMEILQHLWQHVFHKKIQFCSDNHVVQVHTPSLTSPMKLCPATNTEEPKPKSRLDGSKKPRLRWSQELHEKFLAAVEVVGADNLAPQRIMECMQEMGVEGLNRPQISSHLQHYHRAMKKKKSAEEQTHSDNNNDNSDSGRTYSSSSIGNYSVQVPITSDHHQDWIFSSQHGTPDQSSSGIMSQCGEEPQSQGMPLPSNGVKNSENSDWTMLFLTFD